MFQYQRFRLIANAISAALVGVAIVFMVNRFGGLTALANLSMIESIGVACAGLVVSVIVWLALSEAIIPYAFKSNFIRRTILGKYYVEGTWLQAERDGEDLRLAIIDIQPNGNGFMFSGYSLDADLNIQSNMRMEHATVEWPFLTYKYRNSLAETDDQRREGVGEIHFETNRAAPRRFTGFFAGVQGTGRVKIEGVRLTKAREVSRLRTLEGRVEVIEKYWDLFFTRRVNLKRSAAVTLAPQATVSAQANADIQASVELAPEAAKVEVPRAVRRPTVPSLATEPAADVTVMAPAAASVAPATYHSPANGAATVRLTPADYARSSGFASPSEVRVAPPAE
jgi:hypothetical protein